MKDWREWHRAYDDPDSSLSRRLHVVQRRLGEALDRTPTATPRVLSLCAGEGRDVIPVVATRPAGAPISTVLVEADEGLAHRALDAARVAGLRNLDVRCGDAGDPASFVDVLPVDVLLLCGIFGNIEHAAVKELLNAVPALVVDGGHVIWTRGASEPDHRAEIRGWCRAAGLEEIAFDGADEHYGVGLNQLVAGLPTPALPDRLFSFREA